jgi:hypothetical protein
MKKSLTFLFLLVSFFVFSQNNGINFQGVGRNASGAVLATQKISLRFSVIQGSESGSVEYVESKEVTTNAQGIFSVVIGDGIQISKTGNFTDINWKINPKFLKVEMDPAGGTSFTAMGTTRLQSVPFAYYANGVNADNVDGVLSASKGGTGVASISALKTALGVDQINNTSDLAKPISTATQTALDTKVSTAAFSTTVATKANVADLALKANASDVAFKAPLESPTFTGTVSGITRAMVGLSNVENTADLAKPISTATQAALDTKVSTASFSINMATKENAANKSTATDLGAGATSDILFPTQKAVKTYVDGQINSGGIADGGVTRIKIANEAVGSSQLANNSVGTNNIIDGTITNADINTNASIPFTKLNISKANIESLGIPGSDQNTTYTAGNGLTLSGTTFSIGAGAITSTSIADGAISNVDINSSAAIEYTKLNLTGSIVSSDISNSAAIPFSKLNIVKSDIESLGIPGSDQNTTYTAGSGLTLSGSTFNVASNVVTSTYSGAVTLNGPSLNVDNYSIYVDGTNHKIGIGTNSPISKLEVNGASTNSSAFNANSNTTIDFALSNLAYTTASAGSFTLNNIKDGGTYTLAVQGTTSGTSSFSSSGFTFFSTNNGTTTSNKQTLYTFIVMGSKVYFFMATGF